MARKKNTDDEFFAELAKDTGSMLLEGYGSSKYFVDTGNLALNYINSGKFIKGGIPTGITEIYGPPASSKSLIAYIVLGACQRMGGYAVLLDCERAANEGFAVSAGHVDEKRLILNQPLFIEAVSAKVTSITKKIREAKGQEPPIVFVWDSIGVTSCEREWKENSLPEKYTKEEFKKIVGGKEQPGERAKAAGKFLRKINPFLDENNASLLVINQIRDKIGVLYGSPETTAGGGKALPFYANCRIRTATQKDLGDKKKNTQIGIKLKVQNKKSRSCKPYMWTEGVQLYFDYGLNPLSGMVTMLIAAGRIESSGKGKYKILEPWAGGETIVFSASKEGNELPMEIALKCPALIDAKTEKEVVDYLSVYKSAIDISQSGLVAEKNASEEEGDFDINDLDGLVDDADIDSEEDSE